jgi:uncharacterized membrane protein
MVTHEVEITINRPIHEVFAYVSDFKNSTKWQSGLVEVKGISDGPMTVGSQFTGVRNFVGRRFEAVVKMTSFEENKQFAYKSTSGTAPFEQSFLFEPTSGGTKVSTKFEMETSGLMGLAKPLIASGLKRDMSADFETLKNQLENRAPKDLVQ